LTASEFADWPLLTVDHISWHHGQVPRRASLFTKKNGFVEIAKDALPSSFPLMAVDTKFHAMRLSIRTAGNVA
jgi:hypothetical protein